MSYLSDLKSGKLSIPGFAKKSAGWLARLAGFSDAKIDAIVQRADQLTDAAEDDAAKVFEGLIANAFPAVPSGLRQVLALRAAHAGLQLIDAGLAGLGEELKKIAPSA